MLKKGALLFILAEFLFITAGCGTVKNTAKKSWQATKNATKQADDWVRKNLW